MQGSCRFQLERTRTHHDHCPTMIVWVVMMTPAMTMSPKRLLPLRRQILIETETTTKPSQWTAA